MLPATRHNIAPALLGLLCIVSADCLAQSDADTVPSQNAEGQGGTVRNARVLYPFHAAGKVGYAGSGGIEVIAPRFDDGSRFSEGLAAVSVGDKHGYIDPTGTIRIPMDFDAAYPFSEGLARVRRGDAWGFIDRTGAVAVPFRFAWAHDFHEGLALAQPRRSESPGTPVGVKRPRVGYISIQGNWSIAPAFLNARPFSEGLAWVCPADDAEPATQGKQRWAVINPAGDLLWTREMPFPPVAVYSEGVCCLFDGQHWGYVDRAGRWVIPATFHNARPFSDGLAAVEVAYSTGFHYGYVTKTGRFAIKPQFQSAGTFRDGLAPVRKRGKWGFIDENGSWIVEPRYYDAEEFRDGLAQVTPFDQLPGYVDRSGRFGSGCPAASHRLGPRVTSDDLVGLSRDEVIRRLGKPSDDRELGTKDFKMRPFEYLPSRLPDARRRDPIRELFYDQPGKLQRWIWLVKDEQGRWIVFRNLTKPDSIEF